MSAAHFAGRGGRGRRGAAVPGRGVQAAWAAAGGGWGAWSAVRGAPPKGAEGGEREVFGRRLTYLLRHGAKEAGLSMDQEGWVSVDSVLKAACMEGCSLKLLQDIVQLCPKGRYELRGDASGASGASGGFVRATQGHSLKQVSDTMHRRVQKVEDVGRSEVIHGTYLPAWLKIRDEGLKTMGRNHIHLCLGLPESGVVSGMRPDCKVAIYLNVQNLLSAGLVLLQAANGVVLTAGEAGVLKPRFFSSADWLGEPKVKLWRDGADRTEAAGKESASLEQALRAILPRTSPKKAAASPSPSPHKRKAVAKKAVKVRRSDGKRLSSKTSSSDSSSDSSSGSRSPVRKAKRTRKDKVKKAKPSQDKAESRKSSSSKKRAKSEDRSEERAAKRHKRRSNDK